MKSRRVVIVTGAAGCIGTAICQRFLKEGDLVVAVDNNLDSLHSMPERMAINCDALVLRGADVANEEEVRQLVAEIIARFSRISVLINNVGGNKTTLFSNTSSSDWKADLDLNLNTAFYCAHYSLPYMVERGEGVIVNIGSVNGINIYGDPGYSAAKAGLINFTKFLATEYGGKGIRVNVVCPGTVKTEAWKEMLKKRPTFYDDIKKLYSSNKICDPNDVAGPVYFLCGQDAAGINGSTLVVDGGLTAGIPHIMKTFSFNVSEINKSEAAPEI